MKRNTLRVENTNRCPECDTRGVIDTFRTRSDDAASQHTAGTDKGRERARTRAREYECPDCGSKWLQPA